VTDTSSARPRGRPRKDSGPAPNPEVLAAALHAFASHGYQGVSVRTLNRELGVSHNLLHQRFGSKEAIWYAAVDWGFGGLLEELALADADLADPLERLRAFIRSFVAFSARHPDLARVANAEGSAEDSGAMQRLDYLLHSYVRPSIERIAPLYRELVVSERVREVPPETLYYLITSAGLMYSNHAMTRALFSGASLAEDRIESYADSIATVILDGVTRRPGSEGSRTGESSTQVARGRPD